ncbi:exodeoxyribonuclease VII large subunit [Radiobacillus kanasensis]|uniref:exodeoxyribonuclease VII large subunit n=1 Tax=Radiobacillus kanasensis TaxID=2844358 RepID=UPI001E551EBD|nr:exodeoxyribonuclease VII large subunit [Radiobacillus kanasensis]UFT97729.1 exodeoxyribonuclease VII large subunit [Radiobacillus kanasensis]
MNDQYLTVSALTKYLKRKFEMDKHLKKVYIKAEISNFTLHSRGHMYLTLKDDKSRIQAVMFASQNRFLKFKPENGMNVLIVGEVSIYEPQGQYQLYIHSMEPDGIGALYMAYEQLKEKLSREGLFDPSRKKAIPSFPKQIGVITSPTGAAIRDIITTVRRRYPIAKLIILPVMVQGDSAAPSIEKAIYKANEIGDFDVLIVGRGGGSIEELWSFNEERVARAIAASTIPIISAVGHETDFTISDFVADMRAPTPTGAAEIAVPSQEELKEKITSSQKTLIRLLRNQLNQAQEKLSRANKSYAFRYPEQLLKQKEQELDRTVDALGKALKDTTERKRFDHNHLQKRFIQLDPRKRVLDRQKQLDEMINRTNRAFQRIQVAKQVEFTSLLDKLSILNPLNTMKRGYSISYKEDGSVLSTTKQVNPGEHIHVRLRDGVLDCQVWGLEEETEDGREK